MALRIAVLRETAADEARVAATPETVKKLTALGATLAVERGAGYGAGHPQLHFEAAGLADRRLRPVWSDGPLGPSEWHDRPRDLVT